MDPFQCHQYHFAPIFQFCPQICAASFRILKDWYLRQRTRKSVISQSSNSSSSSSDTSFSSLCRIELSLNNMLSTVITLPGLPGGVVFHCDDAFCEVILGFTYVFPMKRQRHILSTLDWTKF